MTTPATRRTARGGNPVTPSSALSLKQQQSDNTEEEETSSATTTNRRRKAPPPEDLLTSHGGGDDDDDDDDANQKGARAENGVETTTETNDNDDDNDNNDEDDHETTFYEFEGKRYATYLEMVQAKRQRNQEVLEKSGLINLTKRKSASAATAAAAKKKSKNEQGNAAPAESSRKSKRLRGEKAEGIYIDDERGGKFSFAGGGAAQSNSEQQPPEVKEPEAPAHYGGRINDGSDMTVAQAVETIGDKWFDEDTSVPQAQALGSLLQQKVIVDHNDAAEGAGDDSENESEDTLLDRVGRLSVGGYSVDSEEAEEATTKVTPERIYGIAAHPSPDQLIVGAGDKKGFVGIWNATSRQTQHGNSNKDENQQVHLFKFHTGAVNTIDWTASGDAMLTTSYDGTCRLFDVQTQSFQQVFAAYDDTEMYAHHPGRGLDIGREFWFQSSCWDHRSGGGFNSFFVSTSIGTVLNVDMRARNSLVWNEQLSEKKINTISLHPNGHSFISSGLDCTVSLWDLRKLGAAKKGSPAPVASYNGIKSINSAYFSPNTGEYLLCTTMNHRLDLLRNFHLATGADSLPPSKAKSAKTKAKQHKASSKNKTSSFEVVKKFPHDNLTGRWLSTFMARWHPAADDLFCVGSMQKPRNVHVYNLEGQVRAIPGLTAVVSRCCFHPSPSQLILVGGNSSGRVTVFKEQN